MKVAGPIYGLAWVDTSTGEFVAADVSRARLADELLRLNASECLMAESEGTQLSEGLKEVLPRGLYLRPDWNFDTDSTRAALYKHFSVITFGGYGFDDEQPCLVAGGAIILYLHETLRASLAHVRKLTAFRADQVLMLDEVTRRGLELTKTLREGNREGSLLAALDRTVTSMGARILHDAIISPLAIKPAIEARLDAVHELLREHSLRQDLRSLLESGADLQRLTTRASTGRASPRDLVAVAKTLRLLPKFKAKITGRKSALLQELESRLELCPDLRDALDRCLIDDPPANAKEGGVIREGFHSVLDELRKLSKDAKDWLTRYQLQEVTAHGNIEPEGRLQRNSRVLHRNYACPLGPRPR